MESEVLTEQISQISLVKILTDTPGFIFWKNVDSVYLGCNRNFAYMAGLKSPEEIKGKRDTDLPWSSSYADIYLEEDQFIISTGQALEYKEVPLITAHNQQIIALISKAPLFNDDGKVVGILGIYMDITERKKMEEALQLAKERAEAASRAKTEFIANMSHDIKTPMSGVIGIAQILESEGTTEKDREYGRIIHTSSQRLLCLLNDILELISVDEIKRDYLKLETFNLRERIDYLRDLTFPYLQSNNLHLNIAIDPKFPDCVVADRIKIDRILLNLTSNALKFTEQGHITISAKVISQEKQKIIAEIEVSDTGIGISKDKINKIFDCFYRISPSYHNKYAGHGIGLYIVHKYATLLAGNISVKSEVGKGSTFIVTVPLKIGKAEDAKLIQEQLAKTLSQPLKQISSVKYLKKQTGSTLKGLLIEDDSVARHVAKTFLQSSGFEIEDVDSAEEGFKRVMEKYYDLIITDIGLPGMNGDQFTAVTRAWEKATRHPHIPIVGLTAHAKQPKAMQLAGMDMLLEKPLDESRVAKIIRHFFPHQKNDSSTKKPQQNPVVQDLHMQDCNLLGTEEKVSFVNIYPLFDEKTAIEATAGMKDIMHEILTMLIKEIIPQELVSLQKAHENLDWEAVLKITHKLKGTALYCGTIRMCYACQYSERYRLAGHSKILEEIYEQLTLVLNETKQSVANWLDA
jgi:PAS domain S-box-containing protein